MFKFSSLCLFWLQRYVTKCCVKNAAADGNTAQIAVIATRYVAVFPLASIINFVHRARGQRHDELPHSYQMMLFWAGLRGAVGVALSNGFQGENAAALRTTVLVVVVLTVIMFGGTTSRMLEVMGIKVGVEEEGSSSDDESPLFGRRHEREWLARSTSGRAAWNGRAGVYGCALMTLPLWRDTDTVTFGSRWDRRNDGDLRGRRTPVRPGSTMFSAGSDEDSYSDGGEVLPMSSPVADSHPESSSYTNPSGVPLERTASRASITSLTGADWSFKAVDERYLLPLFSNSVASRSSNARRASRRAALGLGPDGANTSRDETDGEYEDETEDGGQPTARGGDFTRSVSNFFGLHDGSGRSGGPGAKGLARGTPETNQRSSPH